MSENTFLAGASKVDITPPVGYLLHGHALRDKPAWGVHDPLMAKVITISNGRKRVVLVASDLCYFNHELVKALQRDAYNKFKIRPAELFLTASHTHTGPFLQKNYSFTPGAASQRFIPGYLDVLRSKIIGGITEAIHNEGKSCLYYGVGSADIGVVNRRLPTADGVKFMPNPEGPVDNQVTVLGIRDANGRPKAILTNYACHATTLGTTIYQVSADYPGVYQRVIEQMYPSAIGCFTNGCCGDIRPAIISGKKFKEGTFADTERMGRILAAEAIKTFEQAVRIQGRGLEGVLKIVKLPLDKNLIPKSASQVAALAARTKCDMKSHLVKSWMRYWLNKLKEGRRNPAFVPCDVQVLKIGDLRIVGLAGELMVDYGLKIKARAGGWPVMVCGYLNAQVSYIPTAQGLREGGYEANAFLWKRFAAPYAPAIEGLLINSAAGML